MSSNTSSVYCHCDEDVSDCGVARRISLLTGSTISEKVIFYDVTIGIYFSAWNHYGQASLEKALQKTLASSVLWFVIRAMILVRFVHVGTVAVSEVRKHRLARAH